MSPCWILGKIYIPKVIIGRYTFQQISNLKTGAAIFIRQSLYLNIGSINTILF